MSRIWKWKLLGGTSVLVAAGVLGLGHHGSPLAFDGEMFRHLPSEGMTTAQQMVLRGSGEASRAGDAGGLVFSGAAELHQGGTSTAFRDHRYSPALAQIEAMSSGLQYAFPVRYALEGSAGAVAMGDLDADGLNEVVVAYALSNGDGRLAVYRRAATGLTLSQTFDLRAKYTHPFGGIAIGDLNHDGRADVAIGVQSGIVLVVSGPTGHATKLLPDNWEVTQLGMLDINYDGHLDLVSLHWGDVNGYPMADASRLYYGNGAGNFRVENMATSQRGYNDLKIGDVTGDGLPDLVIVSGQAFEFWVIAHNGVNGFKPAVAYPRPGTRTFSAVAIADVDHDGANDVVISTNGNVPLSAIWVYRQHGGVLAAPTRMDSSDVPSTMLGQDLDGDGRDDVGVMHEGELGIYLQSAQGTLAPEVFARAVGDNAYGADMYNRQGVAAGDITGDGCPDVAIGDSNWGLVIIEGMNCTPPRPRVTGGNLPPELMN
jgi:hypothetical protein